MYDYTITQWIDLHAPIIILLGTVTPGIIWLAWDCLDEILQDIRNM